MNIPEFGKSGSNPNLEQIVKAANERFEKLSPLEKAIHRLEQKRSWIRGELMLPKEDPFDGQGMTKSEADDTLYKAAPEFLILDELYRLRKENTESITFKILIWLLVSRLPGARIAFSIEKIKSMRAPLSDWSLEITHDVKDGMYSDYIQVKAMEKLP